MKYSLQVLGIPNGETNSSFILQMEQESFLFNVPEATQRVAVEHRCRLLKVKNIFLSRIDWNTLGGLPGMLLTLGDMSPNPIRIHGPKGTSQFIHSNRFFITRNPHHNEHVVELNDASLFKNDSVEIQPILVNSIQSNQPTCISYIVQGPLKPGKFNPSKAKKLKLDPALHYKRLIKGESVELSDGSIVHPQECVSSEEPGKRFLIIDCPTLHYIPQLISKLSKQTIGNICLLIHNVGKGVLEDVSYINWLKSIGLSDNVQHLIFNNEYCSDALTFYSTSKVLSLLSRVNSDIYKRPYESLSPAKVIDQTNPFKLVSPGKLLQVFEFEPKLYLNESQCINGLETIEEEPNREFLNKIKEIPKTQETQEIIGNDLSRYNNVKVIPLGTGSSMPSKYRNVSSSMVLLENTHILFDCGEGTLGQIFRHFGPSQIKSQLSKLKLLFISHLHADHHLGTVRVLLDTLKHENKHIYLIAPGPFWTFLSEYSLLQNIHLDRIHFIDSCTLLKGSTQKTDKFMEMLDFLGLENITTVQVDHCPLAYGIVLMSKKNNVKITYSGDCRPSSQLVECGKDSDLLIHEATFDDDKLQDAIKKMHCTQSEAIQVAKRMNAKHLLLTHFSQRYPKTSFTRHHYVSNCPIAFAFDMMSIPLKDFKKLEDYHSATVELFNKENSE